VSHCCPYTALEYYTGIVLNSLEFWIAKQAKLLTNVCDASRKKWERLREYTDSCVGPWASTSCFWSWPSCPTNAKLPLIIRVVLAIILHLTYCICILLFFSIYIYNIYIYYSNLLKTRAVFVSIGLKISLKESFMHEVLNKVYLQNIFIDECNFARRVYLIHDLLQ
jgi:hypothetical protein